MDRIAERFWAKVRTGGGCWEWQASLRRDGYGQFALTHRKLVKAHRMAYELATGAPPGTLDVLHVCDNRRCCNPAHLRLGTQKTNNRDMTAKKRDVNSKKTHCIHGHPLSGDNLYVYQSWRGTWRWCRTCQRRRNRDYAARALTAAR